MKLPQVSEPHRYQGLYVYDFGEWAAMGYAAEEIAVLLETERYRGGRIYRIVRTHPDGQTELRGVSAERFQLESGMFFHRMELGAARADFDELQRLGERGAPCRAKLHLAQRRETEGAYRYVTALIYPAEYEDDMAGWLLEADYAGGDVAEGGISLVSGYYAEEHKILERQQLWSHVTARVRPAAEVLASVHQALQR